MADQKPRRVVVAYSGGLDTSVIIHWLKDQYDCEVIAFTADVGQGASELEGLEEKALATGASKAVVKDLRDEFVRDFVYPAVRAGAVYEGTYLLGTSLARPLIAKYLVEVARQEGAEALCHGATGKGNDQVRFELTAYALQPDISIIAPWREWSMKGRTDLIEYCERYKIPITATKEKPYSMDRNLFHCSYEGGVLEDPWREPDPDMFLLTRSPEQAPNEARYVEVDFEGGNPVAVDGARLDPVPLLERLNALAGEHGVGRVDIVENRFVGMKSRGVYETPGGTILHAAHRALTQLCFDREVLHLREELIPRYAKLVYNGFWYAPEREAIQAMVDQMQADLSGTARLKLYKGSIQVVGRRSERSLYSEDYVTFEADDVYSQKDAEGFIRLNALRLRLGNLVRG